MNAHPLSIIETGEVIEYPIGRDVRLDSHHFMAWERSRWLNSSMRLKGTPECRAFYFDLICVSFAQSPVGTLPSDMEELAKLAMVAEGHFRALCQQEYGPLHKWRSCLSEGERRLYHPMVLQTVNEAIARREDNRARNEAANAAKRRERLRIALQGYHNGELAKNDAAVLWMDDWLVSQGCGYRNSNWVERAMAAWAEHSFDLSRIRQTV